MKQFLEEYGFAILAAIVVILLITFTTPVGNAVQKSITSTIEQTTARTDNKMKEINNTDDVETMQSDITINMPEKGDIITIEDKKYRVLSTKGNQAKVLAMFNATNMFFNDTSNITIFSDGSEGQKYGGSKLDNYLENTWYSGLSQDMKNAIIAQDIKQSIVIGKYADSDSIEKYSESIIHKHQVDWSKDYGFTTIAGSIEIGKRHVFVLDLQDVYDYFDNKNMVSSNELNMMFFNKKTKVASEVWLRSASAITNTILLTMYGDYGRLSSWYYYTTSYGVRPAFVIDLSKIDFE